MKLQGVQGNALVQCPHWYKYETGISPILTFLQGFRCLFLVTLQFYRLPEPSLQTCVCQILGLVPMVCRQLNACGRQGRQPKGFRLVLAHLILASKLLWHVLGELDKSNPILVLVKGYPIFLQYCNPLTLPGCQASSKASFSLPSATGLGRENIKMSLVGKRTDTERDHSPNTVTEKQVWIRNINWIY